MKYAVIYEESYYEAGYDRYDSPSTKYIKTLKEFDTKEELMDWIDTEEERTYSRKSYRVIRFDEMTVKKKIEITVI